MAGGQDVIRAAAFYYTEKGAALAERVREALKQERNIYLIWTEEKNMTEEIFSQSDLLLFFCASGIAVRKTAPFLKDKISDPAVLVTGESGQFVIPLLSGHLGGANFYAEKIASFLGAVPVITTASDTQKIPALDVWADRHGLALSDMKMTKRIMAQLIGGAGPDEKRYHICIASDRMTAEKKLAGRAVAAESALILEPKRYVIGLGCRKGCSGQAMRSFVNGFLAENGMEERLVRRICSVDLKAEERCMKETARMLKVPFSVFSAEELSLVSGDFSSSEFVMRTTGTDNVCERSAVCGSGNGKLTVKKRAENGMTAAAAVCRIPESFCRILTAEEWACEVRKYQSRETAEREEGSSDDE